MSQCEQWHYITVVILSFLSDQQFLQHVYMSTYQLCLQSYRRELSNSPRCPVAVSTQSMVRSSSNWKNYWNKSRKYCLWRTLGCTTKWISFGKPSSFMHKLNFLLFIYCHSVFKRNMDLNWSTIVIIVCHVSWYYPSWDLQNVLDITEFTAFALRHRVIRRIIFRI